MTPEERAEQVSEAIEAGIPGGEVMQRERIAAAIRAAIEEEREACWQIARAHDCSLVVLLIRARSEP